MALRILAFLIFTGNVCCDGTVRDVIECSLRSQVKAKNSEAYDIHLIFPKLDLINLESIFSIIDVETKLKLVNYFGNVGLSIKL